MRWVRTFNTWLARLPWYLDAAVCSLPGVLILAVCGLFWHWSLVAALPVFAVVFCGRFVYHRSREASVAGEQKTSPA